MKMEIRRQIQESISLKTELLNDGQLAVNMESAIGILIRCYGDGGKALFCGNGGSAADAQHLAAELSGRFYLDRPPLNAEALHVNSSFITATANDHSYEMVFARMLQALGRKGDVLLAFSTSGHSPNVIKALETARQMDLKSIGFTGLNAEPMRGLCDVVFSITSHDTARIQEAHMLLGHIICENVEAILFDPSHE